jgi:hypothetical protein
MGNSELNESLGRDQEGVLFEPISTVAIVFVRKRQAVLSSLDGPQLSLTELEVRGWTYAICCATDLRFLLRDLI